MCIICTGKIYKQNLNTLLELNISFCLDLTSEKLQEILIQCKNLTTLYCYSCKSLTNLNLRSNINLTELWCSSCTSLTSLDLLSSSEGVTSFGCVNLTTLRCSCCTSLTSLDLWSVNLTTLQCNYCISLTSLDLRNNINLKELWCYNCTSLTSLDLWNNFKLDYKYINCCKCPWITQNKDFPSNLQRLIRIQKWYRRILLIKYMKSQEFIEWIYAPNNIGGKCYKLKLLKEFIIN